LSIVTKPSTVLDIDRSDLIAVVERIEADLHRSGKTLAEVIRERHLYYRVSIVGNCNLRCTFCHNEGGPTSGTLSRDVLERSFAAAARVGFYRVQLTGGEPLISPLVADYVALGTRYFDDVGVTTNGTYLPSKLDDLITAGISRVHISLQRETLQTEPGARWRLPTWLHRAIHCCSDAGVIVRTNLPVAQEDLSVAAEFLKDMRDAPFNINVFALLTAGQKEPPHGSAEYLTALARVVDVETHARERSGTKASVGLRGYRPPSGIRCRDCSARTECTEQSRSLRFGVDRVLRPCLATRQWDAEIPAEDDPEELYTHMRRMAIVALDYERIGQP
jgi:molybdenum cofactor biosynthesis enzyme MoaA